MEIIKIHITYKHTQLHCIRLSEIYQNNIIMELFNKSIRMKL